jgi:hypothetical protein
MKAMKLMLAMLVIALATSSCSVVIDDRDDPYYRSLEEVVTAYDLWYVDYHRTTGTGDVPFLSKAFTVSFINGRLFANNNLVGIGATGNGYGIQIGYYDTYTGILEIDHDLDGYYDFDVIEITLDQIKLRDNFNNVTYYLEGYQKAQFDYDKVFYDNIEYFLQEYDAWEKTWVSDTGALNEFDYENFLSFTPENVTTFYSSEDPFGTNVAEIFWDYVGDYSVADVLGYDNLKILTLDYDFEGNEEFELTVVDDGTIELYHLDSGTTYEFTGRGYIQYLKPDGKKGEDAVRNDGRKRTKVERETKVRRHLR